MTLIKSFPSVFISGVSSEVSISYFVGFSVSLSALVMGDITFTVV
jgi:hypothetical protein